MTWFRIPMVWQMYGRLDVEADSLQEAIEYALGPESPLPEGSYLDDSVDIDETVYELNSAHESAPENAQRDANGSSEANDDLAF